MIVECRAMWSVFLVVAGAAAAGGAGPVGAGARYGATTTVLAGDDAARGAELGYRLRAALTVRPLWTHDQDVLLHFTLENPQLMLRGKKLTADFVPRASLWDDMPRSEFLALWSAGRISAAYLDPNDPPDILNYKKSLISVFQFQTKESEHNETDISGECEVQYERVPETEFDIRKVKHRCLWAGRWDDEGSGVERRRSLRLTLSAAGALRAARHDDLVLYGGLGAGALTARGLLELQLDAELAAAPLHAELAAAPLHAELGAALAAHPALTDHALPLRPEDRVPDDPEEEEPLERAVGRHAAALDEASAGSADAADAALRLLPAVRRASAAQLLTLLEHPDSEPLLAGLARMLGLAGSWGALGAARAAFALDAPARPALGREYLAALALAPAAEPRVLRAVLRLGLGAGELADDALLAAAAAAAAAASEDLLLEFKDDLVKSLTRCKDDGCRAVRLQALGALGGAGAGAELLLAHAERGGRAPALAALGALARLPRAALGDQHKRRLQRVALALDQPRPLEVRCAALELALETAEPQWGTLRALTLALRGRGGRELRRVARQRLQALAARHPALAPLLPALDPTPATWPRRAHDGTSSVLVRTAGWARLDSTQLAVNGALRRGAVRLSALDQPLLTVEMWTRGLESFASSSPPPAWAREPEDEAGEAGEAAEAEDVEGGLALAVAGVRRRDLTLFASQGELLGHIWAGTGSAPTPALRALLPRPPERRLLPLAAGLVVSLRGDSAAALALDAQAQVSLWGRSAQAGLELRGAGVQRLALAARAAWGALAAAAHCRLAPALALAAALDFYDRPRLCVRADAAGYHLTRNVTLVSEFGATKWRVRRQRVWRRPVPPRTLALGAPSDQACRLLPAAA